jgi:hypothetical protein
MRMLRSSDGLLLSEVTERCAQMLVNAVQAFAYLVHPRDFVLSDFYQRFLDRLNFKGAVDQAFTFVKRQRFHLLAEQPC